MISWWIWNYRNDVLRGKPGLEPMQIVQRCVDWQLVFSKVTTCNNISSTTVAREERWEAQVSDSYCTVLFFDGAVDKENGKVAWVQFCCICQK